MLSKNAKRHTRRAASRYALVLSILTLSGPVSPTYAAFYKCVGPDGSTTYNDTPCAIDESTHVLSKSARELSVLDCRIAHNFAVDVVARMRQDDSALDVFNAYGGVEAMSEGTQRLINDVFTFKDDSQVSSQRIVDLTFQRCQAGLLGKKLEQCEAFPSDFIARSGGCFKARESHQNVTVQQGSRSQPSDHATNRQSVSAPPALRAAKPATSNTDTDTGTTMQADGVNQPASDADVEPEL